MKVSVVGLWHLGTVTAACLAECGHDVTAFDPDPAVVAKLGEGRPPLFEPGLEALVARGLASGRLCPMSDRAAAVRGADIVWVVYDTPVDAEDRGDVNFVMEQTAMLFEHVPAGALVLMSSQVPIGTTRRLIRRLASSPGGSRGIRFGCVPENLRLGKAIDSFLTPDRVVAGLEDEADRPRVAELLRPIGAPIEWMSIESAEMTKHAINAFLATSVTFINEIAALCEQTGADAGEVARGLKSESRIGPRAYLSPGGAIAGGTLARDVMFLSGLGQEHRVPTHLLSAITPSNRGHQGWAARRLRESLGDLTGTRVAVWGLTYKPGTDTLRRSSSVELCERLHAEGALVRAHDPALTRAGVTPPEIAGCVELAETALAAVDGASALVVATPWPEFRDVNPAEVTGRMTRPLVLDAAAFLADTLGRTAGAEYLSVGRGRA